MYWNDNSYLQTKKIENIQWLKKKNTSIFDTYNDILLIETLLLNKRSSGFQNVTFPLTESKGLGEGFGGDCRSAFERSNQALSAQPGSVRCSALLARNEKWKHLSLLFPINVQSSSAPILSMAPLSSSFPPSFILVSSEIFVPLHCELFGTLY